MIILGRYTGETLDALRFQRTQYGKPVLSGAGDVHDLRFNTD